MVSKGYNGKTNGEDQDIFIRDEETGPVTGKKRSEAYKTKDDFLTKFIDARLFGAVSAPGSNTDKKKVFHFTGPVQFGMGATLHVVKENLIKGTGGFTTSETAMQKTFREEYNITYGLVGFHGVINENAAEYTQLMQKDVDLLLEGMWNGTKNLLTRSKKGHMPRLLVQITYNEPHFFIGELLERLTLEPEKGKREEEFEDVADFKINTGGLNNLLAKYSDKIETVKVVNQDDRLQLTEDIKTK